MLSPKKKPDPPLPDHTEDAKYIRAIYDNALTKGSSYEYLYELCTTIGGRLSGSPQAAEAVKWGKKRLEEMGCDTVWLQDVMVPHWVRGDISYGAIVEKDNIQEVPVCALGGSIATPADGITAEVIKVYSLKGAGAIGKKEHRREDRLL